MNIHKNITQSCIHQALMASRKTSLTAGRCFLKRKPYKFLPRNNINFSVIIIVVVIHCGTCSNSIIIAKHCLFHEVVMRDAHHQIYC